MVQMELITKPEPEVVVEDIGEEILEHILMSQEPVVHLIYLDILVV